MQQGRIFLNSLNRADISHKALAVAMMSFIVVIVGALLVIMPFKAAATAEHEPSLLKNIAIEVAKMPAYGTDLPNGLEGKDNGFEYCVSLCAMQLDELDNIRMMREVYSDVIGFDESTLEKLEENILNADSFAALEAESAKVKTLKDKFMQLRVGKAEEKRKAEAEAAAAKKEAEEKAAREEAERKAQEEAEAAAAERPVYPENEGGALTASKGVVYFNGHKETYYSQRVLPGGGLSIPGRHVEPSDGTVRDGDNYICVAADPEYMAYGSIVETSLGTAKVYDSGCDWGTIDIYVDW